MQHLAYAAIYDPDYNFSNILWILLEGHVVQFEHTLLFKSLESLNSQYVDRWVKWAGNYRGPFF